MITEYEAEPIPGLPGLPPKDERILWQGSPDWRVLARTAFHTHAVGVYFAALVLVAAINLAVTGNPVGLMITAAMGAIVVATLALIAWATARSAIYTLTNRRIVLRIGVALPKCINLPLTLVGSVGVHQYADGTGDVPIKLTAPQRLGYAVLWPHARPWRLNDPQPMLRAVPDVADVAAMITRACLAVHPAGAGASIDAVGEGTTGHRPGLGKAVAA